MCREDTEVHSGRRVKEQRQNRETSCRKGADGKWMRVEENVVWRFKTPGLEGVKGCHQHD